MRTKYRRFVQLERQSATGSKIVGTIGGEKKVPRRQGLLTMFTYHSSHAKTFSTPTSHRCSFDRRLVVERGLDVPPVLETDVLLTRQLTNLSLQFQ